MTRSRHHSRPGSRHEYGSALHMEHSHARRIHRSRSSRRSPPRSPRGSASPDPWLLKGCGRDHVIPEDLVVHVGSSDSEGQGESPLVTESVSRVQNVLSAFDRSFEEYDNEEYTDAPGSPPHYPYPQRMEVNVGAMTAAMSHPRVEYHQQEFFGRPMQQHHVEPQQVAMEYINHLHRYNPQYAQMYAPPSPPHQQYPAPQQQYGAYPYEGYAADVEEGDDDFLDVEYEMNGHPGATQADLDRMTADLRAMNMHYEMTHGRPS